MSARVFGGCGTGWSVMVGMGFAPRLELELQTPAVMTLLATCGTEFHTLARGQLTLVAKGTADPANGNDGQM